MPQANMTVLLDIPGAPQRRKSFDESSIFNFKMATEMDSLSEFHIRPT